MSMAPVAAMISGNSSSIGAMKSKIQSIASPGPAVNPSTDIVLFTTTLPLPVLVSRTRAPPKNLRGCHPRRSDDVTGVRISSALPLPLRQVNRDAPGTADPLGSALRPHLHRRIDQDG